MTEQNIIANFDWLQVGKKEHFPEYKVQTQKTMFDRIAKAKKSSFDRSKFTAVGSPTITKEGIASGGSFTDNLIVDFDLKQLKNKSWTIRYPFNFNGVNDGALWSIVNPNTNWGWFNTYTHTGPAWGHIFQTIQAGIGDSRDTGYDQFFIASNFYESHLNEDLTYELSFDLSTGVYTGMLLDENNNIIGVEQTYTPTSDNKQLTAILDTDNDWTLRIVAGASQTCNLNKFSIEADGIKVFYGSKVGVDIIKNDYTVVGNPVVSEEGIASGFSENNNYVLKTLNLSNASSLRIEFANIYCPLQTTNKHKAFFEIQPSSSSSYFGLRLYRNSFINYGLGAVYPTSSGGATSVELSPRFNTAENFSGYVEIKNNILNFVINDTACGSYELTTEQLAYIFTNVNLSIGATTHSDSGQHIAEGSIDLNSFKIYVDDQLVYQPTLRTPYTQAKTGEKIVDAIYRDRVEQMYNEFGYAPYYTLSDSDYTLSVDGAKLERNANNLSSEGKSLLSGLGMPSGKKIDLTLGASGTSYTAPANGWFVIAKSTGSTNQYINFINSSAGGISFNNMCPITNYIIRMYMPCKKGDSINCYYTATGATSYFRFIYAEGEE